MSDCSTFPLHLKSRYDAAALRGAIEFHTEDPANEILHG